MKLDSGIYMIQHRESGKAYVGRAKHIRERWALHKAHTERHKDKTPLHRAFRKYGYDAFDWRVLVKAPSRLHETLEQAFIDTYNTMSPNGYNVGSVRGGCPSREVLDAMGADDRSAWDAMFKRRAAQALKTVTAKRAADPEYDAWFRRRNQVAALEREVRRRERISADPEYAAKEAARRRRGGLLSQETRLARCEADPERAAKSRAKRSASSRKVRERCNRMHKVLLAIDPEYARNYKETRIRAAHRAWETRRAKKEGSE